MTLCGFRFRIGGRMEDSAAGTVWNREMDRKLVRQDQRTWREVLREYHTNAGRRVPVTLPRLRFLEEDEKGECRERAA